MVDVGFEHSLRTLERAWEAFCASARDEDDHHRLCRALRKAKLCFFDIDRWYGTAYDASRLAALTDGIDQGLPRRPQSAYLPSILRHVREIRRRFRERANPVRRSVAIYASSVG